jgi:hypothetical protein
MTAPAVAVRAMTERQLQSQVLELAQLAEAAR